MAASILSDYLPRPIGKRKRPVKDEPEYFDSDDDRKAKRPLFRRTKSTVYAQLPTPDDSSDDEQVKSERNNWYQRRTFVKRSSTCSVDSTQVNLDDVDMDSDDDIDMYMPWPMMEAGLQVRSVSRPRPQLAPIVAVSAPLQGRAPTPTTMRTSSRRQWQSQARTRLSPLLGEEVGLLSPTKPFDPDAMMILDRASNALQGLRVYCSNDSMETDDSANITNNMDAMDTNEVRPEVGRTATLHMGFRDDCEKCTMQVPGHYSHILWS